MKKPILLLFFLCGLAACSRLGGASPAAPTLPPSPTFLPSPTPAPPPTPSPTPAGERGTVTIWHAWDEADRPALTQIIANFQQTYPDIYFDVLYVPIEDLRQRYAEAQNEGSGPSLLLGPAEWGPPLFDAGLVADLTDLVDPAWLQTFNPAALGTGQYQNTLISLPYDQRGVVLLRNKRLIPEAPATFNDLVILAGTATHADTVGAMLERSFFYSGAHLNGIGGLLMDGKGMPAFANEKGLAWVNLLRAFDNAGPGDFLSDRDLDLFKASKAGLIIDGTWNLLTLSQAVGAENLSVDPWPAYEDGYLSGYVLANSLFLNPSLNNEERAAALNFARYFLSKDAQAVLATVVPGPGGHIPAVNGVEMTDPLRKQALAALGGGTTYPVHPYIEYYPTPLDAALRAVFENQIPPEEALRSAEQAVLSAISGGAGTPVP